MPVLVIGADTLIGESIIAAFSGRDGEVRAFVTDPEVGAELKARSVKVAVGDVSDSSHIAGAALHCFSAVLLTEAASDERERSFADSPRQVVDGWIEATEASQVQRVIWVGSELTEEAAASLAGITAEVAVVLSHDKRPPDVARLVVSLDDSAELPAEHRLPT